MSTQDELAIDVEDLRNDSRLWCQAAGLVERAQGQGRGESLPNSAFMMGGISVAAAYRALATQLLGRLADGTAQLSGLCRALDEIATEYEQYEGEVVSVVATMNDQIEVEDV